MSETPVKLPYPRRRALRAVMSSMSRASFSLLSDLNIIGLENAPTKGPLIVVANHFSFLDPALMVGVSRWPLEFLGGFNMPNAPAFVTWIPKIWGYFPVFRGTSSRRALKAAERVLGQGGVLGIYPEAGSWAKVLRPARPGTAWLAARTGAPILPMGFDGLPNVFERLRHGKRAKVTVRIGKVFGPFESHAKGRERRKELDEIGHAIMRHIAELLPEDQRGHYSSDPAIREAAQGTEIYPWADATETDFHA